LLLLLQLLLLMMMRYITPAAAAAAAPSQWDATDRRAHAHLLRSRRMALYKCV